MLATRIASVSAIEIASAADRNDEPREVDLRHELRVPDDGVAGVAERGGEELPRQQSRQREQRIRNRTGRKLGDAAEDDREDHHWNYGPDHRPGDADHG